MRITAIETYTVGAGWKNWLFVKLLTDSGIHGIGEGTLNGFIRTTEAAVRELEKFVIGEDPRRVNALAKKMLDSVSLDGGHIHRTAIAAVEVACWDILGKSLGVPVHQLLGGRVRDSVLGYANGWYRTERTPETFLDAARMVLGKGFKAFKLDPFGNAQGFIREDELDLAYDILRTLREKLPRDTLILIDVHARFTESEALRVARRMAPLGIYWWEEPTTRDRQEAVHSVAAASPIPVATGEMYDTVGQFFTLAERGGVNIFQPEPMSLGGITNTLAVANLALAHGSYIAPHQSGGPVATAVCLQLAACVPNFLIQEHFDAFNEPWTRELVSWHPVDRSFQRASVAARCAGSRNRSQHRSGARAPIRPGRIPQHLRGRLGEAAWQPRRSETRMKITGVETLRLAEFPFLLWLRIHTDAGLIGTGETFWAPGPVAAYLHDNAAPYLLGKDPRDIELHDRRLGSVYVGARDSGAEMRGNSAVNIALWDIYGQALGEPRLAAARRPHARKRADLQHLRRLRACPRHQAQRPLRAHRGLVAQVRRHGGGAVRGSARLPLQRRHTGEEPSRRRHPRR